jgi:hypothetical protein
LIQTYSTTNGCDVAAFIEQAREEDGWPDPEATRQRAFTYFEQAHTE